MIFSELMFHSFLLKRERAILLIEAYIASPDRDYRFAHIT